MYLNAARKNSYLTQTGNSSVRPSRRTLCLPGSKTPTVSEGDAHDLLNRYVVLRERFRRLKKRAKDKRRLFRQGKKSQWSVDNAHEKLEKTVDDLLQCRTQLMRYGFTPERIRKFLFHKGPKPDESTGKWKKRLVENLGK